MAYSELRAQGSMFFDHVRNDAYFNALKQVITPDSVVLDLGAGLGLHGLMAASLGARKVYLVEPEKIGKLAMLFAKDNNLNDAVEYIQGRIEDIELPEKVDVITSVLTGNFLLNEDLLPSLYCARDRWLKPNGVLIPDQGRMYAVPVSCESLYQRQIGLWQKPYYGFDLKAARQFACNQAYQTKDMDDLGYLAEPSMFEEIDFCQGNKADCSAVLSFEISTAGSCHGFIGWFDIRLGDLHHSSSPHAPKTHWSPLFYPFAEPLNLSKGSSLELCIDKPRNREWVWRCHYNGQSQKQSTLFSVPQ